MSVGKRLRFEILKRDNFRCCYCGKTAGATELHVDHVIPRAKGGSDEPSNLVTTCVDCNAGKSDVHLHELDDRVGTPAEEIRNRLAQAHALLDAQREVEDMRTVLVEELEREWDNVVGVNMPITVKRALKNLVDKNTIEEISKAIEAVSRAIESGRLRDGTSRAQYFFGTLKQMREQRALLEAKPEERAKAAHDLCVEACDILNEPRADDRSLRRAEQLARRAMELDEKLAWAAQLVGCAFHQRGLTQSAKRYYDRARELAPNSYVHYWNLGLIAMDENNLAEAQDCFGEVTHLNPKHDRAHERLAVICAMRRDECAESARSGPDDERENWESTAEYYEEMRAYHQQECDAIRAERERGRQ